MSIGLSIQYCSMNNNSFVPNKTQNFESFDAKRNIENDLTDRQSIQMMNET